MLKNLLPGLLFCWCDLYASVEELSDAIVKSDIVHVKQVLQEYSLSVLEKQALLDLAQETIVARRHAIDRQALYALRNLLAVGASWQLIKLSLLLLRERLFLSRIVGLINLQGLTILGFGFFIKELILKDNLVKQYDDAVAIKQLIWLK